MVTSAIHAGASYTVVTDVFQGPLDLLLYLIERAELDITRLSLAQVTDQYLEHLKNLEDRDPEEVSAFLVIAARLLQIKSAALLPRPTSSQETALSPEEEPTHEDDLVEQLKRYKRFKEAAEYLHHRESQNLRTYTRSAPPLLRHLNLKPHLEGLSLEELILAARNALIQRTSPESLEKAVMLPRITIRQKITHLLQTLRQIPRITFRRLLGQRTTRTEVVVTFLAMLELIKQRLVIAHQPALFAEIEVEATGELPDEQSLTLEFED
ncbi:MAG: segregation/condensation protein A [Thermanaerothrix sp.]|nr:segregation/condensation protein A [Thermanaerothrix sp.]